jgi:hypothetical protein
MKFLNILKILHAFTTINSLHSILIFQYISNKMQRYTVYLETALHVSGGTITHHQERIQLYLQRLVFMSPLLIPASIVGELEPV